MKEFTSQTRLLVTGTPLQNKLEELWSLLHFLLPQVFVNYESFIDWFDFSDLNDEDRTEDFISDKETQQLVKKLHVILQPLLLRRIKADVEHMLPKKREYVLYAPLTKEQVELYKVIDDKNEDTRRFLEDKVVERLTSKNNTPITSRKPSPTFPSRLSQTQDDSDSEDDKPLALRRKSQNIETSKPLNVFQAMMAKKPAAKGTPGSSRKNDTPAAKSQNVRKRKIQQEAPSLSSKSAKSSRQSTPASSRGRKRKVRTYTEADVSDEDMMSDDEVEQKWAEELATNKDEDDLDEENDEEIQRQKTLELASMYHTFRIVTKFTNYPQRKKSRSRS